MLVAPARPNRVSARGRRAAAVVIAGVVSVALAVTTITVGGGASSTGAFALYVVGLPWTISIYVLTMVFDVTSPAAIAAVFALVTLLVWRSLTRRLLRGVSPREP